MGISLALLGLSDGRLASSFDDNTIKITNDLNFENYTTLIGHSGIIKTIVELDDHILATGSCDKTIKLWNLTSMTIKSTIYPNQGLLIVYIFDKSFKN